MELDDKFFNIENYEFRFFLEGQEIPILAARIQIGKQFSFSIDIPPADFDFKPLSWGVLLSRENEEPWRVVCNGFYLGHGISKNLSSKKYNLKFVSLKYIYATMRFLDLTAEGQNRPYALHTKAFVGDNTALIDELEGSETLRANIIDTLVSKLGGGGEAGDDVGYVDDVEEAGALAGLYKRPRTGPDDRQVQGQEEAEVDLGGFIRWILGAYVNNSFSKAHLEAFKFSDRFAKVIENTRINKIFEQHLRDFAESIFNNKDPNLNLDKILRKILTVFKYDLHHIPCGLKDGEETLIKPQIHLGIPPACNIMFPHETYSYNFNKNYQNIPTRFRLHTFIGEDQIGRYFFSPREISTEVESYAEDNTEEIPNLARAIEREGEEQRFYRIPQPAPGADGLDSEDYESEIDENRQHLTEEEKYRNIIPSERNHQVSQIMPTGIFGSIKRDEEGEVDLDESEIENEAKITDYMFYEERYKGVTTSANLKLKLGLLPGMPGVLLDQPNSLVGHINSVSHFIDLESPTGGTSVTMNFLKKDNIDTPIISGWYEEEMFKEEEINNFFEKLGTKTYYQRFESDLETKGENETHYWINLKESLDTLYNRYIDYPQLAEGFARDLPTANEFLSKMGLGFENGQIIINDEDKNPFNIYVQGTNVSENRLAAVLKYLDNLGKESTYGYNE